MVLSFDFDYFDYFDLYLYANSEWNVLFSIEESPRIKKGKFLFIYLLSESECCYRL